MGSQSRSGLFVFLVPVGQVLPDVVAPLLHGSKFGLVKGSLNLDMAQLLDQVLLLHGWSSFAAGAAAITFTFSIGRLSN